MNIIDAWLNNPWAFFGSLGIAGAAAVFVAYRFFGLKGAGVALAVLGALAALRNARKQGYDARVKEDTRIAENTLDRAQGARARVRKETENAVPTDAPVPLPRKRRADSVRPKPDPYDRRARR